MPERITKKAKIEALLQAGKAPREIAEILGVSRRYAVAVAWRMRNPEREKTIKCAGRERLRADPAWLEKNHERRRKRDRERRRKERSYRDAKSHAQRRWRLHKLQARAKAHESG